MAARAVAVVVCGRPWATARSPALLRPPDAQARAAAAAAAAASSSLSSSSARPWRGARPRASLALRLRRARRCCRCWRGGEGRARMTNRRAWFLPPPDCQAVGWPSLGLASRDSSTLLASVHRAASRASVHERAGCHHHQQQQQHHHQRPAA
eukprot:scaffold52_cov290-Prasinococcus_capsulatus_cf.AAC.5